MEDLTVGNHTVYLNHIEPILLDYLASKDEGVITFTKRNLWHMLGLVNDKYDNMSRADLKKVDNMVTDYEINQFYLNSNRKLDSITLTALNSLQNRGLINWELQIVVCEPSSDGNEEICSYATKEESDEVLAVEQETLTELGFTKMIQVFSSFKQNEFYNSVNKKLLERFGWSKAYRVIKISYDKSKVDNKVHAEEIILNKETLNLKLVDFLYKNASYIYNKSLTEYNDRIEEAIKNNGDIVAAIDAWKMPPDFVFAQNILVDELIRIKPRKRLLVDNLSIDDLHDDELDELFAIPLE